jgi:hypothetical protein
MADDFKFSVDDILNEIHQMTGESSKVVSKNDGKTASAANPKEEVKTEPLPETKAEADSAPKETENEDKLKTFLGKSHESDYKDEREAASKDAKAQIGLLYDGDGETLDADEIFTVGKKHRAPHAITKDELLSAPASDKTITFDAVKPLREKVDTKKDSEELNDLFSRQKVNGFKVQSKSKPAENIDGFKIAESPAAKKDEPKKQQSENAQNIEGATVEFNPIKLEEIDELFEEEAPKKKGFFSKLFGGKNKEAFEDEDFEQDEDIKIAEKNAEEKQSGAESIPEDDSAAKSEEVQPEQAPKAVVIEQKSEDLPEPSVDIEIPVPITEAAAEESPVDEEPIQEQKRELSGEKEQEISFDENEYYEEIDDYSSIEDAPAVREDLNRNCSVTSRKFAVSLFVFIGLALFNFLPIFSNLTPAVFLGINIVLSAVLLFNDFSNMFRGLFSLLTFRANADSAVSASLFASIGQCVYLLAANASEQSSLPLCTTFAALFVVMSYWGKHVMATRVRDNFELIANDNVKQVCKVADEAQTAAVAGETLSNAKLCYDKSVINVQLFLNNSFTADPVDKISKVLAPISLIAAILTAILMIFVASFDLPDAVNSAVLVLCMGTPITSLLASNLPLRSASKKLREFGGVITGNRAVENFADVTAVAVDAEELFPSGSVELLGMKNYGETAIDRTLIDAAAVAIQAGGPLADVFDKIIEGRRKILPKVTNMVYEDGYGISGTVGNHTLRIGNRSMMEKYRLNNLPDNAYDKKVELEGKSLVYLSVDETLAGVFLIKYNINDEDLLYSVGNLIDSGASLIVKTCDANITSKLIADIFEVDEEMIKIMPSDAVASYDELTSASRDEEGMLIHNNSMTAFAMLLTAANRLRGNILMATVLQTIGVLLGFTGAMFLAITGAFSWLSAGIVIGYQVIAALITVILPAIRGI